MVDVMHVKIVNFGVLWKTGLFDQILNRFNANNFLEILGGPNWNGTSPVSVSREAPIVGILKPLLESLMLGELGDPFGLKVVNQESFLKLSDLDEPAVNCLVNQRGF